MRKLNNYTNNTKQALHPQNNSINAGAVRQPTEIRQYKDNVFCLLYRDKNNLLDLYNGLNDTNYTNVNDLTVTTLKGGVYMKYKNDASFVFGQDLYMFEQQSSNSNMHTYNSEFLSKCETLKDYMTFVNKVRVKTDVDKIDIRTAVIEAVDECIAENVLSDFFQKSQGGSDYCEYL